MSGFVRHGWQFWFGPADDYAANGHLWPGFVCATAVGAILLAVVILVAAS